VIKFEANYFDDKATEQQTEKQQEITSFMDASNPVYKKKWGKK